MGPVSNRYQAYHAPSLQHKYLLARFPPEGHLFASFLPERHLLASFPLEGQGSAFLEPLVRVPYVGTHHLGFQHTLSEHWEFVPWVENMESFPCASTRGVQLHGDTPYGAFFDNLQDSLVINAMIVHTYLVQPFR
jgi:hypothetical protein